MQRKDFQSGGGGTFARAALLVLFSVAFLITGCGESEGRRRRQENSYRRCTEGADVEKS